MNQNIFQLTNLHNQIKYLKMNRNKSHMGTKRSEKANVNQWLSSFISWSVMQLECCKRSRSINTTLIFSLSINGESNCSISAENFSEICMIDTEVRKNRKGIRGKHMKLPCGTACLQCGTSRVFSKALYPFLLPLPQKNFAPLSNPLALTLS